VKWHNQARDLGALERSDISEMNWVTALFLMNAQRYEEAIPYYRAFLATGRRATAPRGGITEICLTKTGKSQEAEDVRRQYGLAAPQR